MICFVIAILRVGSPSNWSVLVERLSADSEFPSEGSLLLFKCYCVDLAPGLSATPSFAESSPSGGYFKIRYHWLRSFGLRIGRNGDTCIAVLKLCE